MISERLVYRISAVCTSCANCVEVCPTGSIFYVNPIYTIDADSCHGCGICARVCPVDAISPLSKESVLPPHLSSGGVLEEEEES